MGLAPRTARQRLTDYPDAGEWRAGIVQRQVDRVDLVEAVALFRRRTAEGGGCGSW